MPKLKWDETGTRIYETGTKNGVVYPMNSSGAYPEGVAWNGLTAVTESPSGADITDLWADDMKYASIRATETFGGTIEAYTYPDEFAVCDGSAVLTSGVTIGQQPRKAFGFCYRTVIGNDVDVNDHGYKLHLIYGATVSPSEKAYSTINDSPDAITFSWEFQTTPVAFADSANAALYKPTACIVVDSTKTDATKLQALLDKLYGTDGEGQATGTTAYLPLPDEVLSTLA